jgi:hypothetical protein
LRHERLQHIFWTENQVYCDFILVCKVMKFTLFAFAALTLWAPRGLAQTAVLIGLHLKAWDDENGTMHPPSYRTFLVTYRDGKARLVADIPDLIVPRKDGFWRVGSLHKGAPREGGYQEFVYAAPVESVPHAIGQYIREDPNSNCSQTNEATVEFLSPELLSVSNMRAEGCSLESERQHGTYKLDNLQTPLDIATVLGPAAWAALKKGDGLAKAQVADELKECKGVSEPDPTKWGLERSSRLVHSSTKPWILVSDFSAPHVCSAGDTYEIKFQIPESVAGISYHVSVLSSLIKSSAAKDIGVFSNEVLLSPSGDVLVAFGNFSFDEAIRIFEVKQQSLSATPLLSVSTHTSLSWGFNVVMIEWAIGKHVAQWESDLKRIAGTSLPEPAVDIGNPEE